MMLVAKETNQGNTAPGEIVQWIDLVRWTKQGALSEAWRQLAEHDILDKDTLEKATRAFLGFVLGRNYLTTLSLAGEEVRMKA